MTKAQLCQWLLSGDNNILVGFIKPVGRKPGLEYVNWRCLRTSHATWLKMAGADVKDAQASPLAGINNVSYLYWVSSEQCPPAGDVQLKRLRQLGLAAQVLHTSSDGGAGGCCHVW